VPELIGLYHRLPAPLRSVAASVRGWQLRRWRYGPETERLVAEARERECWSADRWDAWRQERLAHVLWRAATQVPYYRQHWTDRRRRGDRTSWEGLQNWPVLRKEAVRQRPAAFLADDCSRRKMLRLRTSGSTGTPLQVWRGRDTDRRWYALFEARALNWNGVSRVDRWAMFGGLVARFDQQHPPFWVRNAGMRQLYLSSYHLAPRNVASYLEALRRWHPSFVLGYPSAMHSLAHLALRMGLEPPPLRVAISNAEPLLQHQREAVARAFQCPVRDTYGMTELVAGGSECEAGELHLWPEVGILEVLDDEKDQPLATGRVGRLVCTALLNTDMPLIRYDVGDRGALASQAGTCPCGRSLPCLQKMDGRSDDLVLTADGRRIGRLDAVFQADLAIVEAQLVQESRQRLRVRFVPASGYTDRHGREVARRLRERVGDMEIELEPVDHIPRSPTGKLRGVISKLAPSDEASATGE
jgi:phenylacetate-CoA ligase